MNDVMSRGVPARVEEYCDRAFKFGRFYVAQYI